jgi:serine/threonine-protein kinase
MAPEQLQGWADPRTDIHGLGLTLYELVALRPAHDAEKRGELMKQIGEQAPAPLSRFDRHVPRDLETIVGKMIAHEPGERYPSAREAASDLSRFLADEPIRARPSSAIYRFRKFAHRNRAAIAGVASIVVALLLGTVLSTWQAIRATHAEKLAAGRLEGEKSERDRAERHLVEAKRQQQLAERSYREARQAIDQLFVELTEDTALNGPDLAQLRRGLLESALHYYQVFIEIWQHDPQKIAELAESYRRAGVRKRTRWSQTGRTDWRRRTTTSAPCLRN